MTQDSDEAPLVDEIAARIRDRIMSGAFAIGMPLRQAALANEFGVSRTPVREALRQLQHGGLIEVHPNRGAVVRVPAPWEVRQAYEVRAELEGLAAQRAAVRISSAQTDRLRDLNKVLHSALEGGSSPETAAANDEFHTIICAAAENAWLLRMVDQVNASFPRNVSSLVLSEVERHRRENVHQHDEIIAALASRDPEAARAAMYAHIISSGEHLSTWYEQRSHTVYRG
ncbi:GntR family transcriptional regulator [Streptomyces sp. NPDC002896]|uniref:GntR family transcriptional regulator n=1 Tax=Streptomyces sp. NPDC002896 TaxID=3154438 RepID=UPI003324CD2D